MAEYYGARVRAARAFADMTQQQLADALQVDVQTIKRREYGPHHELHTGPKKGERLAIAQICGVPVSFMEEGFGGVAPSELTQRLADLESLVQELHRELLVGEREASTRTDEDDQPGDQSLSGPPR